MKKFYSYAFLAILITSFSITAKWTVLTYIAGDNSLSDFVKYDIAEMQAGTNENVNTLAFVCTSNNGYNKDAKKLIITKDKIMQDGPSIPNLDSGIASSVIQAANWAIDKDPTADKFCIIFWNHGSGPLNRKKYNADKTDFEIERGICYDDTTGHYLNDYDLKLVMKNISDKLGKKVDIIAFDACLMAGIELAFTVQEYANYYVASQELEPGTGYKYDSFLKLTRNNTNATEFAYNMVNSYDEHYKNGTEEYTLSALNLNYVNLLANNINNVSDLLTAALNSRDNYHYSRIINKAAAYNDQSIRFSEADYIDLYSFYRNLYFELSADPKNPFKNKVSLELLTGMILIQNSVLNNKTSKNFGDIRGISIYLPQNKIEVSYPKLYWSHSTSWTKFLQTYFAVRSKALSENQEQENTTESIKEYQ